MDSIQSHVYVDVHHPYVHKIFFFAGHSLPAPGKLIMSKHSTDSILLQWTAAVGISGATLLGYRVYVNGLEEGMVSLVVCVVLNHTKTSYFTQILRMVLDFNPVLYKQILTQ